MLDRNRNNRISIINDKEINEVVYDMFPFFRDYDYTEYSPEWPLEYKETEKFGIFVMGKGGSTLTNNIFRSNELNVIDLDKQDEINKCVSSNNNFILGYDESMIISDELSELKNILLGKSKKDLIFVIRNPILKWMSGLCQELDEELKSSLVATSFISEKYNTIIDEIGDLLFDTLLDEETKGIIFSDLAYKFLRMSLFRKGTSQINHMQLYNEYVYLILENNPKIDLSKVRIINLDDDKGDLVELFKKYYPDIKENSDTKGFWTQREKYKIIFGGLRDYISKNNRGINEIIKKEIQRDLNYYHLLLKKYDKNIIK